MDILIQFLILLILSFSIIPIYSFFVEQIKQQIKFNKNKKTPKGVVKLTINQSFNRYRKFAFKEYSKKTITIVSYFIFFLSGTLISFIDLFTGIVISVLAPFFYFALLKILISTELQDKESIIDRMLTFKKSKMGLINTESNKYDYQDEFDIIEWSWEEDPKTKKKERKPIKFRLYPPVTFDPLNADSFLADFSTQFGRQRPFEIDFNDKDYPGWDTDKGVATIILEKELPRVAKWSKHYLEDPTVQWSFFPLGLGSKGGVPIKNPETGEIEHVIGIDVEGTQRKYCDKNGIKVGKDIIASPMTLIAGKQTCFNKFILI